MSDLNQIHTALERLFNEEGQRIVFWNDPDREFQNTLPLLSLDGVTTLRLDEVGALGAKYRLEREEPTGKFLLYAPTEEPDYEDDWLLDIRLYSRSFRADRASILLQELGLVNQSLRTHIAERRKFFDAKDRLTKVKNLVLPDDAAGDLDRKMIAVVLRADQPELFNLVRTAFHAWTEAGAEIDLDDPPAVWGQVVKFDLDVPFWQMVKATFGYEEENPSLKNFLLRLVLTDYAHHLKGDVPQALRGLLLPRTGWSNAVVCLAQWRDSSSKGASYDRLSAEAAAILKIEDHLPDLEIDQLLDVMTFLAVEKRIASSLRERVQATAETINADDVRAVATRRQAGHWASLNVADTAEAPRQALHAVYDALVAAADFYALRNQHKGGFDFPDATAMYRTYETELYRFDQLYRHFCEAADTAEDQGWNVVKPLRADIEARYVNWYLTNLALAWGKFIEPHGGLLSKWQIDKVPNQHRFYDRNVRPWLDEGDTPSARRRADTAAVSEPVCWSWQQRPWHPQPAVAPPLSGPRCGDDGAKRWNGPRAAAPVAPVGRAFLTPGDSLGCTEIPVARPRTLVRPNARPGVARPARCSPESEADAVARLGWRWDGRGRLDSRGGARSLLRFPLGTPLCERLLEEIRRERFPGL